jgi:hypothetical protein
MARIGLEAVYIPFPRHHGAKEQAEAIERTSAKQRAPAAPPGSPNSGKKIENVNLIGEKNGCEN